ncbi:hypothetical protein IF2G_04931 [Cordyceps javanica]|nr:hypothetical protein IF2G_04931 [Cordyceps javanica]
MLPSQPRCTNPYSATLPRSHPAGAYFGSTQPCRRLTTVPSRLPNTLSDSIVMYSAYDVQPHSGL